VVAASNLFPIVYPRRGVMTTNKKPNLPNPLLSKSLAISSTKNANAVEYLTEAPIKNLATEPTSTSFTVPVKSTAAITSAIAVTTILATLLSLSACQEDKPDRTTIYGRGKYDARIIKHEVHAGFLNCYPLDPREKKQCINLVADKYLKEKYDKDYQTYLKSFQSESEKLGFKYFLEDRGLACKSVPDNPTYDSREDIYLVRCSSGQRYHMQFDYDNREWNVKNSEV
jgi:hypothetical protein